MPVGMPAPSKVETEVPLRVRTLGRMLGGCRDDLMDGVSAKVSLVKSFVASGGEDLLNILLWLHLERSITVDTAALLKHIRWRRPAASPRAPAKLAPMDSSASTATTVSRDGADGDDPEEAVEAQQPGFLLASTLSECAAVDMAGIVDKYFASNPSANVIEVLRYVNRRGFIQVDAIALLTLPLTNWKEPPLRDPEPPQWRKLWQGKVPAGAPTYASVRGKHGHEALIAFLGAVDDTGANPTLKTPQQVFIDVWQLDIPTICINADAGTAHPRQSDSIHMMANLPQFHELCTDLLAETQGSSPQLKGGPPELIDTPAKGKDTKGEGSKEKKSAKREAAKKEAAKKGKQKDRVAPHSSAEQPEAPPIIDVSNLMNKSIEEWQAELEQVDTDSKLHDNSISSLIHGKLKDAFSAMLGAAALTGSWVVVDRTCGRGSPTAEFLIELALARGAPRPHIVSVDSLERLGKARAGSKSHSMLKQLNDIFGDEDNASQCPNGTEKELKMDFLYNLDDFDSPSKFRKHPDPKLPFEVLQEHKRQEYAGTCEPNLKWGYFYMDGLFSSATHHIIKNNDLDEFDLESLSRTGYFYAHGDSITYQRLRKNIQQGKPVVMLHNSGGVVTAFSSLQRAMAFRHPPPPVEALRGPLKFLVASLSKSAWVHDFGMPEIIMMNGLAKRAPQLFKKNIVSCDVLTDGEEQVMDLVTSCFTSMDSLPPLGLGNSNVNVLFHAWKLHVVLCENAYRFHRQSARSQLVMWALALATTFCSVFMTSMDSGGIVRYVDANRVLSPLLKAPLGYAVLLLPLLALLVSIVSTRMQWRSKSSVCQIAAAQLAFEIYKFRSATFEYDLSRRSPSTSTPRQRSLVPLTDKEMGERARRNFVNHVHVVYDLAMTEISQGHALKRERPKVERGTRHAHRCAQEDRPTLVQWCSIKKHVEKHYYNTSWNLPHSSFLNWISGLQPYLELRAMRDELRPVMAELVLSKKLILTEKQLGKAACKRIRHSLEERLGLAKGSLEAQQDEIRAAQREVVVQLFKEQTEDEELEAREKAEARAAQEAKDAAEGKVRKVSYKEKRAAAAAAAAPAAGLPVPKRSEDEERFTDAAAAMRKHLMELQGLKQGAHPGKETSEQRQRMLDAKEIEDDYLFGSIGLESYVAFRVRPLIQQLERQTNRLSSRLSVYDMLGFFLNALGAALAVLQLSEWVTFTVVARALVSGMVEFTQLRNQLVSSNIALRELEKLMVKWDSLPIVSRRSNATMEQFVDVTERALLMVVQAHSADASSTPNGNKDYTAADIEDEW